MSSKRASRNLRAAWRAAHDQRRQKRAAHVSGARFPVPYGYRAVAHYATDLTPCGCITHERVGVSATSVAWYVDPATDRYQLRCLNCDARWSRAVLDPMRRNCVYVDASHPEEQAARRR